MPAPLVMPALSLALALAMAVAKECTNVPTQLSSHTVRARLQGDPSAEEWRLRALFHDHAHVSPTDEATWMDLRAPLASSAATEESGWAMLYRALKGSASGGSASAAAGFLEEVPLQDVRLDMEEDAVYGRAQQTNLEYLLLLDVDRLLWSFRTQAGLPAPGKPYGGWEGADVELRGHFVGT